MLNSTMNTCPLAAATEDNTAIQFRRVQQQALCLVALSFDYADYVLTQRLALGECIKLPLP